MSLVVTILHVLYEIRNCDNGLASSKIMFIPSFVKSDYLE